METTLTSTFIKNRSTFRFFILVFLSTTLIPLNGQTTHGIISNEKFAPIPYASVWIKNTSIGGYSDANGKFQIPYKKGDTLMASCIGYKSKFQIVMNTPTRIVLQEDVKILSEVTVQTNSRKNNFESRSLGNHKNKRNGAFTGEYGTMLFIPNEKHHQSKIMRVFFKLHKNKNSFKEEIQFDFKPLLIRLVLNNLNDKGEFYSLIENGITKKILPKEKFIEFDIDSLNLEFPQNGIFVGIEFIGFFEDDILHPFNSNDVSKYHQFRSEISWGHSNPNSWTKHGFSNSWKLADMPPDEKMYRNFNFGIEILVFD